MAKRFHFKKKLVCVKCKGNLETFDVSRTKYFIIQFPFLIIGFLIICFAAFYLYLDPIRPSEPIGLIILGFALILFALAFQIMDNKQMEKEAKDLGMKKIDSKVEKERISIEKTEKQNIPLIKDNSKRSEKISQKDNVQMSLDQLFSKPNKPLSEIKRPSKQLKTKRPIKTQKISDIHMTKPDSKKPRKIRKAI